MMKRGQHGQDFVRLVAPGSQHAQVRLNANYQLDDLIKLFRRRRTVVRQVLPTS